MTQMTWLLAVLALALAWLLVVHLLLRRARKCLAHARHEIARLRLLLDHGE